LIDHSEVDNPRVFPPSPLPGFMKPEKIIITRHQNSFLAGRIDQVIFIRCIRHANIPTMEDIHTFLAKLKTASLAICTSV
jgi:hypothetical protein